MGSCFSCGKKIVGEVHCFSGYTFYVEYCAMCCPRELDGSECGGDHSDVEGKVQKEAVGLLRMDYQVGQRLKHKEMQVIFIVKKVASFGVGGKVGYELTPEDKEMPDLRRFEGEVNKEFEVIKC